MAVEMAAEAAATLASRKEESSSGVRRDLVLCGRGELDEPSSSAAGSSAIPSPLRRAPYPRTVVSSLPLPFPFPPLEDRAV